jgi:hypothetical protein
MSKKKNPGFRIIDAKGFHITFANGCTVSVRFGYGNHCNSNQGDFDHTPPEGVTSPNAEVAAWRADDSWLHPKGFDFGGNNVIGYLSPGEVAKFIQAVASIEAPNAQAS